MAAKTTSWGGIADWYDGYLEGGGTYQADLILPNLIRLLDISAGERVLDVACGQGFFSRAFAEIGAAVTAVDISPELIALAQKKQLEKESEKKLGIAYHVSSSDNLSFIADGSMSAAACVLAIQNIKLVKETLAELARVLKPGGRAAFVLNHPAFRIPKHSAWGFEDGRQFRRVDAYMSEMSETLDVHPGARESAKTASHEPGTTTSFHRPLQYYFKLLANAGFTVAKLEEWVSAKKSQPGPRAAEEDRMRKEIPLFLCFVAEKRL